LVPARFVLSMLKQPLSLPLPSGKIGQASGDRPMAAPKEGRLSSESSKTKGCEATGPLLE
jgi:hypothetical protein